MDEKRTPKGYYLHQFEEAFARYLGDGASEPQQRNNADEKGTSAGFQSATDAFAVAVQKCEKSANDGLCCGVADKKGDLGGNERTEGGNGLAGGLSQRTIQDHARWYTERAYASAQETGGDTRTAELDAGLRQVLAKQVLPEFIEVEFERVMAEVFRV
jgi:hypothetical protein